MTALLPNAVTRLGGSSASNNGGGGSSTDFHYQHVQGVPSSSWIINHNLGARPNVSLHTTGGLAVTADVVHTSANQVIASFSAPLAGYAICS